MVLNEEKRAKLVGALARCKGASGAQAPLLLRLPPLLPLLLSRSLLLSPEHHPLRLPLRKTKGWWRLNLTRTLQRAPSSRGVSLRWRRLATPPLLDDLTPSASSPPGLLALEGGGESAPATPSAPELPDVLQYALKGFQTGVMGDSDEATTRERMGLNFGALLAQSDALISRTEVKEQVALTEAKAKGNGPTGSCVHHPRDCLKAGVGQSLPS